MRRRLPAKPRSVDATGYHRYNLSRSRDWKVSLPVHRSHQYTRIVSVMARLATLESAALRITNAGRKRFEVGDALTMRPRVSALCHYPMGQ
jgi:hypothetical protein